MPHFLPLLIFIATPLIEIMLFIYVNKKIGLPMTIISVVLTAIAGIHLLRWQGLTVLKKTLHSVSQEKILFQPVIEGMVILAAGILLLVPGFLTDGIGLILFVPFVRRYIVRSVSHHYHVYVSPRPAPLDGLNFPQNGQIIEGEIITREETITILPEREQSERNTDRNGK